MSRTPPHFHGTRRDLGSQVLGTLWRSGTGAGERALSAGSRDGPPSKDALRGDKGFLAWPGRFTWASGGASRGRRSVEAGWNSESGFRVRGSAFMNRQPRRAVVWPLGAWLECEVSGSQEGAWPAEGSQPCGRGTWRRAGHWPSQGQATPPRFLWGEPGDCTTVITMLWISGAQALKSSCPQVRTALQGL